MTGRSDEMERSLAERKRIVAEYRRREADLPADRYAPWQPAELFFRAGRLRAAAALLRRAGLFPERGTRVLEIGCGARGWIPDLLGWGVREAELSGVDLDEARIAQARESFPAADLRVADASVLPFPARTFRLVVLSTVFSSILDEAVRRRVASEATRVVATDGGILWYDFAVDNPSNPNVRGVNERELRDLFPGFDATVCRVTLAPPLARLVVPRAAWLAALLETFPFLRTHRVALLRASSGRKSNG
jgi:SAM-dependent methyltransferase